MTERRFNWLILLPPAIFLAIAGTFMLGLSRDNPNELPSALQGRTAPALDLPGLAGVSEGTASADLSAPGVKLVNFWASWCAPCRSEHPNLQLLADSGITIIGVNYKDRPENAASFLAELGNPFAKIGTDEGRTGINWGIYGVPETFVIDGSGTILLRHPGPITRELLDSRILPAIAAAR